MIRVCVPIQFLNKEQVVCAGEIAMPDNFDKVFIVGGYNPFKKGWEFLAPNSGGFFSCMDGEVSDISLNEIFALFRTEVAATARLLNGGEKHAYSELAVFKLSESWKGEYLLRRVWGAKQAA